MKEKDLDQILMNVGKEIQEKQFDWNMEDHKFSDEYENKKQEILNSLEVSKKQKIRWPISAAMAIAITACISLTVYAAAKMITVFTTNEKKDTVSINVNKNTETYIPPIEITPEYLPSGYSEHIEGKYSLEKGGNGITIYDAGYSKSYTVPDISDYQEQQIGDAKAVIINRKGYEYPWQIYLFYENTGHVIGVFGCEDLSKDEMVKVCENLIYKEVPEKDPNRTYQAFSYEEEIKIPDSEILEIFNESSLKNSLIDIGDKNHCSNYGGESLDLDKIQYSVKSINIKDKVNMDLINKDTVWDYDNVKNYIQDDGTLKPYTRVITEWKDGALQERVLGTVAMKNVEVIVEVENSSDTDIEDLNMQPLWKYLQKNSEGGAKIISEGEAESIPGYVADESFRYASSYGISYDGMAYYFDSSNFTQSSHFYNMKLNAGQTKEVHMWFAIPEDKMEDVYLIFNLEDKDNTRLIKIYEGNHK